MSIFICENSDCEEHNVSGTDDEWVKLREKSQTDGCFIISKDCPSEIRPGYEIVYETENLIAVRKVK